jgi:hypothetical protein
MTLLARPIAKEEGFAARSGGIFINAALEQNILRRPWVPWIDVYFNAGDEITEAAQLGALALPTLRCRPFAGIATSSRRQN